MGNLNSLNTIEVIDKCNKKANELDLNVHAFTLEVFNLLGFTNDISNYKENYINNLIDKTVKLYKK